MRQWLEKLWYEQRLLALPLLPLSGLFYLLSVWQKQRKLSQLKAGIAAEGAGTLPAPVIVVGNITVGGTGKTPTVIAIVEFLQRQGYKPGVISRGYGGNLPPTAYPYQLHATTTTQESGDEPLLIALRCGCPVVVAPKRLDAAEYLLANNAVDIIVADDGLQHYALPRDIEICVVDSQRQLGNGLLLPAGPLRELPKRLQTVDFIVMNGEVNPAANSEVLSALTADYQTMVLQPQALRALAYTSSESSQTPKAGDTVHAVAAIGNPQRFFNTLAQAGFVLESHAFADHHPYQQQELLFADEKAVIMTEKDAVKCQSFTQLNRHYYLPIEAQIAPAFWSALADKLQALK